MEADAAQALSGFLAALPCEVANLSEDCSLVYSGIDFPDGDSVALRVTQLAPDHFLVSDAGMVADRLGDAGVDLSKRAAGESWRLVTQSEVPVLAHVSEFEIARTTTSDSLGESMWEVAVRCLQADGLRVLGKHHRHASFTDRAMYAVADAGFAVKPRASLRNKFGGVRQVHFQVQRTAGADALLSPKRQAPEPTFVMTANTSGSFMESHDAVLNAFRGADADVSQRVALLGPNARPEQWHLDSLAEECRVQQVTEVGEFAAAFAR